jgi:hypothetical protein
MFLYRAFGLVLQADLAFPELLPGTGEPDVVLKRAEAPFLDHKDKDEVRFSVGDLISFSVQSGSSILYYPLKPYHDDLLRSFVLGIAFSIILYHRNFIVLHANAILKDDHTCRIVMGVSGAGKSTSAAHAFFSGQSILTDDVVAITQCQAGEWVVVPSYPQLRVTDESLMLLGQNPSDYPLISRDDKKRRVFLRDQFENQPRIISEMYELDVGLSEPQLVSGFEKLSRIQTHLYAASHARELSKIQLLNEKLTTLLSAIPYKIGPRMF